jgi:predicted DNA-binding protein (UPF0251 family)
MSPRPTRLRKISNPPVIAGLKPYGNNIQGKKTEAVFLNIEEYESLRLCDFEMLNHHQASVIMDVSRPTLTRIYAKARQKIAEALVLGKQIIIEGGKIYFDSEWFSCKSCGCFFNNPEKQEEIKACPLCSSSDISECEDFIFETGDNVTECRDKCICHACGYEKPHDFGIPCRHEICPNCGQHLVRKDTQHSRKNKKR